MPPGFQINCYQRIDSVHVTGLVSVDVLGQHSKRLLNLGRELTRIQFSRIIDAC
jgi:hypothetical protein